MALLDVNVTIRFTSNCRCVGISVGFGWDRWRLPTKGKYLNVSTNFRLQGKGQIKWEMRGHLGCRSNVRRTAAANCLVHKNSQSNYLSERCDGHVVGLVAVGVGAFVAEEATTSRDTLRPTRFLSSCSKRLYLAVSRLPGTISLMFDGRTVGAVCLPPTRHGCTCAWSNNAAVSSEVFAFASLDPARLL